MKKVISLVLCIVMLFSAVSVCATAANEVDINNAVEVRASCFLDGKVTYTIHLKPKVKLSGVIFYIKYDPTVLEPVMSWSNSGTPDYAEDDGMVFAENGAYTIEDKYGDKNVSVPGIYVSGMVYESNDTCTISYVSMEEYTNGSSLKPFMSFDFNVISSDKPVTSVEFSCTEFRSTDINLDYSTENKAPLLFYTHTTSTQDSAGHVFSPWIIDKQATCTANGSKHVECSECKTILETEEIPATGHKTVKDPAVKATCTKAGKTEGSHCSVCKVVIKAQETIAKKGHTVVKDPAVKATCTKAGKTEGSHCSVCKAVIKAQKTVAKKGHTASSWIVSKKATVNAAGSKYQKCTVCGVKLKTAVIPQLKCAAPKLKSVENVATGIKFTWNKVTGADNYEIYRKTGNGAWKKLATVKGTVTTYTDKTAKSGTTYKYTVKAKNEAGLSGYNTTGLTIKCLADPVLKAPTSTKKGITLKWNKVTGAQGYVVYRKAGNGKLVKLATVKGVSKISYTDKSAKKGTKYTYQIKAYSGKTYSAYSNAKTIKDKF